MWKKLLKLRPMAMQMTKMEAVFLQIEQEILNLKEHGLGQHDDICLWKRENGDFRPGFMTSQTWHLIRMHAPRSCSMVHRVLVQRGNSYVLISQLDSWA